MVMMVTGVEASSWFPNGLVAESLCVTSGFLRYRRTRVLPVVMPVTIAMVVEAPSSLVLERTINRGGLDEVIE